MNFDQGLKTNSPIVTRRPQLRNPYPAQRPEIHRFDSGEPHGAILENQEASPLVELIRENRISVANMKNLKDNSGFGVFQFLLVYTFRAPGRSVQLTNPTSIRSPAFHLGPEQ